MGTCPCTNSSVLSYAVLCRCTLPIYAVMSVFEPDVIRNICASTVEAKKRKIFISNWNQKVSAVKESLPVTGPDYVW